MMFILLFLWMSFTDKVAFFQNMNKAGTKLIFVIIDWPEETGE